MKRENKSEGVEAQGPRKKPKSYSMLEPRIKKLYLGCYAEIYGPSRLDHKTKELIAIASALVAKCQGCLEGHIRKALKDGCTKEEISEAITIAMSVNAAAIVDLTDIAAHNLQLEFFPTGMHAVPNNNSE